MKAFKRIMLVDRDLGLLISVKNWIGNHNFIVDTFSNPIEALVSFKPELYD
jgi:hypothetical protein